MRIVRQIADIRAALHSTRASRAASVGLVPTMGALHAGHVSLFRAARGECDTVVASVFVNPAQFGEPADFEHYPRDEARDAAVAEEARVDLLFVPEAQEIYPAGFDTWVDVGRLGTILEGAFRPGHFRGVATVCLQLFNIVHPDVAYFGQKDAQQVQVLRQMIRDFHLGLEIRVCPIVRDADGLALSSRNVRLTPEERQRALRLPRALATGDVGAALALLEGLNVEYVEVAPFDPPVLAAAVRVGAVRLIDNTPLSSEQP